MHPRTILFEAYLRFSKWLTEDTFGENTRKRKFAILGGQCENALYSSVWRNRHSPVLVGSRPVRESIVVGVRMYSMPLSRAVNATASQNPHERSDPGRSAAPDATGLATRIRGQGIDKQVIWHADRLVRERLRAGDTHHRVNQARDPEHHQTQFDNGNRL